MLVPNIEAWEARLFGSYWYALELPWHLFHYLPASPRHLARTAGMQEVSVTIHPNSAFEYPARYMVDDVLRAIGLMRGTLASSRAPSLQRKAARKGIRMTALRLFSRLAPIAGAGDSIHTIFWRDVIRGT